ncbi:hypothetical protein BASA81_013109 [Batrachochytrium salamandrivorans]|nr:hypothetical protein BASA81_013109 [Batrachochytrium salamandrivorans]
MFDPLFWVLHHFVTHYAGQTTQGDKDDGDAVDQVSGSKDAASLPLGTTPTTLPTTLQESNILDQSGASSSTDLQPGNECTGGHGIRKLSKSCPQQQSQPGSQPSTLYDPPQSHEIPLPARVGESKAKPYSENWGTDQYIAFTEEEARYFKSEYSFLRRIGKGRSGKAYLVTRESDGMEVIYKSIPKPNVEEYALESTPPLICHLRNPLAFSEETSVAQCMSSRPSNLYVPQEFLLQMHLSRPGHESPYVPVVLDYLY